MPEGDSIRRLADRVQRELAGRVVTRSVFRTGRLATVDLTGRRLLGADAVGKNLLLRFDDTTTLAVHLLMQGRIVFGRADAVPTWRRRFELSLAAAPHDGPAGGASAEPLRSTSGVTRLLTGVDVPRLERLATRSEGRLLDHLGPDVCGAYEQSLGVANLVAAGERGASLAGALLDQRVVAGLGNIYAVEAPFLAGIDPRRPVRDIVDPERVLAVAVALIRTNARLGPQNTTGRRPGTSDHWVLNGRIRHCPLDGTRLLRLAERDTPWGRRTAICPTCQSPENARVDVARVRTLMRYHPARHLLEDDALVLQLPERSIDEDRAR